MSIEKPENLGEVILRLANSEEKTYIIPHDVAVNIKEKLGNAIQEAINNLRNKEVKECPHAHPFKFCAHCEVSPCPLGLPQP